MNDTLETINCPACGKPMQKVFIANTGFNLDVCCDGCGGIFFDNKELKFFDEQNENIDEIAEILKNKTFQKVDESQTRICPVCGNNMVKNHVSIKKEIQIDECYNCGAKFLDNGELELMREQYATEKDRQQDFLSSTYSEIGSKIDNLELQNTLNQNSRSKLLKLLDKLFFRF